MEYHLDRKLRFVTEPSSSLYSWAINEIDHDGNVINGDQIPLFYDHFFTATETSLSNRITIIEKIEQSESEPLSQLAETRHEREIRATLRPGNPYRQDDPFRHRETTYRMFGTDRAIKDFVLSVRPLKAESETETCRAWGSVSYTAEVDFRNETAEDCIWLFLNVKPSTFDHYAELVSTRAADELILRVGRVSGFYSEWSPSISTDQVKVLTRSNSAQSLDLPNDTQYQPPRLGVVGEAELRINVKDAKLIELPSAPEYGASRRERRHNQGIGIGSSIAASVIKPQMVKTHESPKQSSAITYRLGWGLWWLSLAIAMPLLGLMGWAVGNHMANKSVALELVVIMTLAALAVIGVGRLLRYVLAGD